MSIPFSSQRRLLRGLRLLQEAAECAADVQADRWDFAVEIAALQRAGLTTSLLRWLVVKGYVDHAIECTPPTDQKRLFREEGKLVFHSHTCFVLTDAGAELAETLGHGNPCSGDDSFQPKSPPEQPPSSKDIPTTDPNLESDEMAPDSDTPNSAEQPGSNRHPHWDGGQRKLWVSNRVIVHFRRRAPNQEVILAAFEEEGWPERIDDPLTGRAGCDGSRALRAAVYALNQAQHPFCMRFMCDGSGHGVLCELKPAISAGGPQGATNGVPHRMQPLG